ncbi:MAG: hypothetical protein HYY84_17925 [Deltaproteobacteria bacterium]|nr:hypothetical protein [Deltaproteobacteria bacterium]
MKPQNLALLCVLAAAASHASAQAARPSLASLRAKVPGLGALVPIATIKATLEKKIAAGTLPAGEKGPDDLAEWKCPAPKPGETKIGGCVHPVAKYEGLLPGIDAYIDYIWARVGAISDAESAVAVLYNFGCREVSRHMPGYARITKVTIPAGGGVQTAGDWDAPIDEVGDALGKPGQAKRNEPKGDASKYKGPPKKDEVVEVCAVTHLQLEETLKKDLGLLVKKRGRGGVGDDPKVLQGKTNALGGDAKKAVDAVRSKLKLADGKGVDAERLVDIVEACQHEKAKHVAGTLECETSTGDFNPDFERACQRQHGKKLGINMGAEVNEKTKTVKCRIKATALGFIVSEELLKQDLGDIVKGQPHLKGETFRVIVGRLSGFFRKAGKARVFDDAKDAQKGHVRLDNAPKELKEDVDHQNATAPKQTDREGLRLKVDQWTDAWEYRETTKYLGAGAELKTANDLYQNAEKVELRRFWNDCNEIGTICEKPALDVERAACVRCAYQALFTHCIDGRQESGRCTDKPSLGPPDSAEKDDNKKKSKKDQKEDEEEARIEKKLEKALDRLSVKDSSLPEGGATFPYKSGNTVYNWMVLRSMADLHFYDLMRGSDMTSESKTRANLIRSVALRWFLPFASVQSGKRLSTDGKKAFDQMPISQWQKCYLWDGGQDGKCALFDEDKPKKPEAKVRKWAETDRAKSPLFKLVLADERLGEEIGKAVAGWKRSCDKTPAAPKSPGTAGALPIEGCKGVEKHANKWKDWCAKKKPRPPMLPPVPLPGCKDIGSRIAAWKKICDEKDAAGTRGKLIVSCSEIAKSAERAWDRLIKKGAKEIEKEGRRAGGSKSKEGAGSAVAGGVSSIMGTVLGILMKALGLEDMMKTIAQASGISPEQTVDCEDPEYRKETMGLSGANDNKLACLGKIFAKNFGSVLESLIVMLGKKLVDWVMGLLRETLGKAKQVLLTAAGSVPYVGGVLVALVEVAWWLVFDVGVKQLLKGVVIANLPKWLKIKELVTLGLDKLASNPIVATVMGFILNMIQSAAANSARDPAQIAFGLALDGIQLALQAMKPPPVFWIRALTFAKKELVKKSKEGMSIGEQIKVMIGALIEGFKMGLSARLDEEARKDFEAGVDELKAMIEKGKALGAEILKNPVGFIVDLVATKVFPIAIPLITSFVKMPDLARGVLKAISRGLRDAITGLRDGNLDGKKIMGAVAGVAETIVELVIDRLPIASDELKAFFKDAVGGIAWALKNIDQAAKSLKDPWAVVAAIVTRIKPVVKWLVAELPANPALSAESRFLETSVNTFLDILASAGERKRMFGEAGKPPEAKAVLGKVAEMVRPYLGDRLGEIARPLGLEKAAQLAVGALLGPEGLFAKGEAFLQGIPAWLKTNGEAALATIIDVVSDFFAKRGAGGGLDAVVSVARGVVGAIRDALKKSGGLAALAKDAGAAVLRIARDALKPFVDKVIEGLGTVAPALVADAKAVLDEIFRLFENPAELVQRGKAAWQAFVAKVGENVRAIFKAMVGRLVPAAEVQAMAAKVVLDEAAIATTINFLIDKVMGGSPVAKVIKEIVETVVGAVAKADSLKALVGGAAKTAMSKLLPVAKSLVAGFLDTLIRDSDLRKLADAAVGVFLTVVEKGLSGGADVAAIVRDSISQVATDFAAFLRGKLGAVLPERWGAARALILRGFDALVSLTQDALKKPDEIRRKLGDGKQVVGSLVDGAVDLLKGFAEQAIGNKPARSFVAGLFEALGTIARNVQAMALAARGGGSKPSAETILPLVGKIAESFLTSVLVEPMKPGPGKKILEFLVKRLADALKNPAGLIAFAERVAKSDKANAKEMIRTVAREVIGGLLDELKKRVPTLADILKKATEMVLSSDRLWGAK